jgi:hypothetical protein
MRPWRWCASAKNGRSSDEMHAGLFVQFGGGSFGVWVFFFLPTGKAIYRREYKSFGPGAHLLQIGVSLIQTIICRQ